MSEERDNLPPGWAWATLGEVCTKPQYGYTTKASSVPQGPRYLRITDLRRDGVDWNTVPFCNELPPNPENFELENGDLVIARAGSVGKAYRVVDPPYAIFASYLIRFKAIRALDKYLEHFLNSPEYWRQIEDVSTGTTMYNVNASKLAALSVPLAPLPEQQRIVEKIEALFEQSRSTREALDRIPKLIRQFRQSVLAAAFRGDLTERDPNDEPASVLLERIGAQPLDDPDLPVLPEGWCYTKIEALLSQERPGMKTGPFGTMLKKHEHQSEGVPVLGIENIGFMEFVPGSKIHITPVKAEELIAYKVYSGDVLISRSGTVGEVCVVPLDIGEARISTNLMWVVLASNTMLPEFFGFLFNGSPFVLGQVAELCSGSTREFLNQKILKSMVFPLPPFNEQHQIVARILSMLAYARELETAVSVARRRVEMLDHAILARAFRGGLVPQDPDDEPASALLQRIRAERD